MRGTEVNDLLALGETNGTLALVINAIPGSEEGITEDGERANGLGEIHSHEAADTGSLDFKDIVKGSDGEVVAGEGEGDIRKRVTLAAVERVLSVERFLGTDFLVAIERDG